MSDTELLALLIQGSGIAQQAAIELARRILAEAGTVATLLSWTPAEFRRLRGIGAMKALQLTAVAELGRRMLTQRTEQVALLNRADLIYQYLRPIVAGLEVEKFYVLCLNRKNRLIKQVAITSGTTTAALAHPREVFREALRVSACAVICAHNHPSGDPAPSAPDLHVTRVLREASRTVDIELLDHVIIGRPEADPLGKGYHSFREAGLL